MKYPTFWNQEYYTEYKFKNTWLYDILYLRSDKTNILFKRIKER